MTTLQIERDPDRRGEYIYTLFSTYGDEQGPLADADDLRCLLIDCGVSADDVLWLCNRPAWARRQPAK